ncbi:MAG: 3-phosphoshikimate 1-carboxyvinyltransferase [Verrucomicrobia bacterium]|nr:3-phosphoshikimate 1-carboxyvinyltransferase [Verrucomicrobiota bacterium]
MLRRPTKNAGWKPALLFPTLRISMPLLDPLPITPFTRPVRGDVTLPGSKSLTNRALLLAALSEQPVTLTGALFSEDTQLMAEALRKLGFTIESNADALTLRVSNQKNGFNVSEADLFVGLAGTAARFLTALCAAAPRGKYRIDGVPQMRQRPMQGLITALRELGADIRCTGEEGFFPLEINARGLRGGRVALDASESSQLLSALLMVAPLAQSPVEVTLTATVRRTFVDMTLRLMAEFGVAAEATANSATFRIAPATYSAPDHYSIEPDATAASYFQALPLVAGGSLTLPGLRPPGAGLQGDSAFVEVLERVRARKAGAMLTEDFHEISDTFLTLAAIAPLLSGATRITGIAHTRKHETDRVAGMARELQKVGQHVIESHDALEIHPRPLVTGQTIETYHDHRFAMSFGILGSHDLHRNGRPWLSIRDPGCCAKTFPQFFELLESVRAKSLGN